MTDTYNAVNGQLYSSFNPTTAFTTIGSQNNSPVSISQTSGATEDLLFQAGDAVTTDGSDSWTIYGSTTIAGAEVIILRNAVASNQFYFYSSTSITFPINPSVAGGGFSGLSINTSPSITTSDCFREGTLIRTPTGETAIEDLKAGDLVAIQGGGSVKVKWIGVQTISKLFAGPAAQLVRFSKGAIGNHSDLFVTPDHGMIIDNYIVNASALVDGDFVELVPLSETPDIQRVYHVETENHDIIYANGAEAETYLCLRSRQKFDNYNSYLQEFGEEQEQQNMLQLPRITSRRLLPPELSIRRAA